jgi:hypothetical protein
MFNYAMVSEFRSDSFLEHCFWWSNYVNFLSQGNLISIWNLNADSNVESKLDEAGLRGREILNRFRFPIFPDWEQERGERGLVLKMLGINHTEVWFLERGRTRELLFLPFLGTEDPSKGTQKKNVEAQRVRNRIKPGRLFFF